MKDEIKEILKYIQKYTDEYETTNLTEIRALQMGYVDTVLLLDYITNLQDKYKGAILIGKELNKENERLKELCDKYEEEHSTAFKLWTMKMKEIPTYEEKKELQSRIDKAIEDIDLLMGGRYCKNNTGYMAQHCCNLRLEIIKNDLQGKSDE